jgi:toluene monooxygenase system ferredoxin subunit
MSGTGTAAVTMHEAMHIDDLWEGEMAPVEVQGTKVLLINVDGEVNAYQNRCPHQAWPLDEGDFDGETLTCIRHMWQFDAASGRGINPDDCSMLRYRCEVGDDGMIWVDVG